MYFMYSLLGTLLHFWGVFQFTQVQPLPSPHKQCWTRVSRIFFYSLDPVRKNYLVLLSLHFKVSTVTKELKIAFSL